MNCCTHKKCGGVWLGIIYSFVVLVGVAGLSAHAAVQDLEALKNGVVMVKGPQQVGTGIIIGLHDGRAYIATASHVIEGGGPPTIYFFSDPRKSFTAKILGMEGGNPKGLAALEVDGDLPADVVALAFDTRTQIKGGEDIDLIGFPRVAGRTLYWGVTAGKIAARSGPDLVFSGAANAGNSGGPVLYRGKVVGIVTEKVDDFGLAKPATIARYELEGWQVTFTGNSQVTGPIPVPKKSASTGMVLIPASTFQMGSPDGEGGSDEHPQHTVTLDAFYLDTHEVTNRLFQQFVQAYGYKTTAEKEGNAWGYTSQGGWKETAGASWRQPEGDRSVFASGREAHPVVSISWEDAKAYCVGVGKRLPTEAEWEYAARAGTTTKYWWGHELPRSSNPLANLADKSAKQEFGMSWAIDTYDDGYARTAPVGSFKANPWGLHDMSGNVWEWVGDWYDADYYQASPKKNPQRSSSGKNKVLRGGSWTNYPTGLRSAYRFRLHPADRYADDGVRCAQDAR